MSGVATAVVAAAVIGSVASNRANKKAIEAQEAAADRARAATSTAAGVARLDAMDLSQAAGQAGTAGYQRALDVFGQSVIPQGQAFQQGNVAAQQAVLAGLPQIQNAILGGNVNYSAMQPFQLRQGNLDFLQQQLPREIVDPRNMYSSAIKPLETPDDGKFGVGGVNPIRPPSQGGNV